MITYSIYFRDDRVNKAGEHKVYLLLIQNQKKKYVSLNISTRPEHWDIAKGLPNKKHPLYTEIKAFLDQLTARISGILWTHKNLNKSLTIDQLISKLQLGQEQSKADLFDYFDQTVTRLMDLGRIGYAGVFRETKRQLVNFSGKKEFSFYSLDYVYLNKFEEWVLKRDVSLNSCFVFLRTLKTLINNARKEGVVDENYNPFKDFSFLKYRRVPTKKRALSKFSIDGFKSLKFPDGSSLARTKNLFLFSYYCRGINFKDMAHLKWSDISDNCLNYTRAKNQKALVIRLETPAQLILDYFKRNYFGSGPYIFPVLNLDHKTPLQKDNRMKKVLKEVNLDLKTIADHLNIERDLTFYAARHTFATVSKRAGVPTAKISEAMGHGTERMTQVYLDSFENSQLDDAFRNIL